MSNYPQCSLKSKSIKNNFKEFRMRTNKMYFVRLEKRRNTMNTEIHKKVITTKFWNWWKGTSHRSSGNLNGVKTRCLFLGAEQWNCSSPKSEVIFNEIYDCFLSVDFWCLPQFWDFHCSRKEIICNFNCEFLEDDFSPNT
jgi:hypothetical protein